MPLPRTSITSHDDVLHYGSAKRDAALGVAGLIAGKAFADSYPLMNILRGILPVASGWTTAPTDLANVTDGDIATVTGTGSKNIAAGAVVGYLTFDLGSVKTCIVGARCGVWSATGNSQLFIDSSDDDLTYRQNGNTVIYRASVAEAVVDAIATVVTGRYIRLRFVGSTATTYNVKIYEAYAHEVAL